MIVLSLKSACPGALSTLIGALLALLLGVPVTPAEAQATIRVAVLPFSLEGREAGPRSLALASELGSVLDNMGTVTTVLESEVATGLEHAKLSAGEVITPQEAFAIAGEIGADAVVYGAVGSTKVQVAADAYLGDLKTRKVYRLEVRETSWAAMRAELGRKLQGAMLKLPELRKVAVTEERTRVAEKKGTATAKPETDPLTEKIAKMNSDARRKAAIAEFSKIQETDDPQLEREALERAIRYDPDFALAHYNLGVIAFKQQDWDAVRTHLRRYLELKPDDPKGEELRKYINYAEEQLAEQARRKLRVEFVPTAAQQSWSGVDWYNAGLELVDSKPEVAVEYFRRASLLDPSLYEAHYNLGKLHYDRQEYVQARRAFEDYLARAPANDPDRRAIENLIKHLPEE